MVRIPAMVEQRNNLSEFNVERFTERAILDQG